MSTWTFDLSRDESPPPGCAWTECEGARRPLVGPVALLQFLQRGETGSVWRGRHAASGADVVLKLLHPAAPNADASETPVTDSTHLLRAFETGFDAPTGLRYAVRRFVEGIDAGEWTQRLRRGVTEAAALRVVIAATRGLQALHEAGWVHRDVKPDNILLPAGADGVPELDRALLMDTGQSHPEPPPGRLTGRGLFVTTFGFAAPEELSNSLPARRPSDVFAMAATLYALLVGGPPFRGPDDASILLSTSLGRYTPIESHRRDVSTATRSLVTRCLAAEPERRPQDASELLPELEACIREAEA